MDLMEQILDQTEGAQESTDPPTEQEAVKHQDAEYIIGKLRVGTGQCVLQSAQGAGG